MENLSALIGEKRREAGLSQEKLAEIACVNRTTVRRYESGDFKNLDFYQLHNLSKAVDFNLLTYLSASCEGLSMEGYAEVHTLYYLIANAQKDKVAAFLTERKQHACFHTPVGRELYCYARALLYTDQKKFNFALDCCALGLHLDVRCQKIGRLSKQSIVYLKMLVMAANCLMELGKIERSKYIYEQIYDFIIHIDGSEREFRNSLFYEDFFDFRIVTLSNMAHLLRAKGEYGASLKVCEEAIRLMFENNAYKYYMFLFFNKAQAQYGLGRSEEARKTLLQIFHFFIALGDFSKIDYLKSVIASELPAIADVAGQMTDACFGICP